MSASIGIVDEIRERTEALHRIARARGMSQSAIDRLPRLPRQAERIVLPPPVLATPADGVHVAQQESGRHRKKATRGRVRHAEIKSEPPARDIGVQPITGEIPFSVSSRVRNIAAVVAEAAGLKPTELLAPHTPRRLSLQKHMAVYLAANLTTVGLARLGEIFQYADHTPARYALQKVRYMLRQGFKYQAAVEFHDKALAAIKARWPEYDR